jgi:hypothetical protein
MAAAALAIGLALAIAVCAYGGRVDIPTISV